MNLCKWMSCSTVEKIAKLGLLVILQCTVTGSIAEAKESVYAPALCVLFADQFPQHVKILEGFVKLGVNVSISFAPECAFPSGQSCLNDLDKCIAEVKAIGAKLSKKITRLGYKKLPKEIDIVTGSECTLPLPANGPAKLDQMDFRFVLITRDGKGFKGAIVQNHIVILVREEQAVLPNQPIYGGWMKRRAVLSGNDNSCSVELRQK